MSLGVCISVQPDAYANSRIARSGGGPPPDVEEPPVQPPFGARAVVDRQRRGGQVLDDDRFREQLEAAK
jgi:hypothetical protein